MSTDPINFPCPFGPKETPLPSDRYRRAGATPTELAWIAEVESATNDDTTQDVVDARLDALSDHDIREVLESLREEGFFDDAPEVAGDAPEAAQGDAEGDSAPHAAPGAPEGTQGDPPNADDLADAGLDATTKSGQVPTTDE